MPLHWVEGRFAHEAQSEEEPQFESKRTHKEQGSSKQTQSKHQRKQEVLRSYWRRSWRDYLLTQWHPMPLHTVLGITRKFLPESMSLEQFFLGENISKRFVGTAEKSYAKFPVLERCFHIPIRLSVMASTWSQMQTIGQTQVNHKQSTLSHQEQWTEQDCFA